MKMFIILLALCLMNGSMAHAQTSSQNLPGNSSIVVNRDARPRGVFIYNDDNGSLTYRTVVKPYERPGALNMPNTVPMNTIDQKCKGTTGVSDLNKCIHDAIKDNKNTGRWHD